MFQYTVNTTTFQCLLRYMFRLARSILEIKNYVEGGGTLNTNKVS
jgi:hypothetical protein